MDAMSNFEFVIRNSSDGQLIYRCDTADEARKWRKNSKSLGIDCTIFHQLKDKPSDPKTTPEQPDFAVGDLTKTKDKQVDPSNCPHFELGFRDGDNRHDCTQCGAQVQISGSTRRIVGVPKTKTNGRNPKFKVGDWVVLDFAVPHLKNHKLIKITADDIGKPYTNNYKHATAEEKTTGHRIDAPVVCIEEETPELFESKHCSPRPMVDRELNVPTSAAQQQIGGNHYTKLAIQPMHYSLANNLNAAQHTIIKYVTRYQDKGGVEDLLKARHTLDLLIEHLKGGQSDA